MSEEKFYITIDNKTVAEHCDIDIAMLLVKAILEEHYAEPNMVVAIARDEVAVCKKYVPRFDDDWSNSNE